jgi:hypothetical protein
VSGHTVHEAVACRSAAHTVGAGDVAPGLHRVAPPAR